MTNKTLTTLLFASILFSCSEPKKEQYQGYTKSNDGYYFKLLAIGEDTENKLDKNSVLVFTASMKKMNDSVFWDTKHDAVNGLIVPLNQNFVNGSCNSYFNTMAIGDSVSFLIKPSTLFKQYFNSEVPSFCTNDTLLKYDVKLIKIMSAAEYIAYNKTHAVNEDIELLELKSIQTYLSKKYPNVIADTSGLYTLKKTTTTNEAVTNGKHITVKFKASYLDGRSIDQTPQELEFVFGTPDQVIKGLNIVIGRLKKGETTKIIVPSRLAFGEQGSTNKTIAPYTPLIYELQIIDIK